MQGRTMRRATVLWSLHNLGLAHVEIRKDANECAQQRSAVLQVGERCDGLCHDATQVEINEARCVFAGEHVSGELIQT